MPALTITKSYSDGAILTEAQLDAAKSSIETWANTTKLDSENIQPAAIGTSLIASSAVTTAKIAAGAVTKAKLAALGQQVSSSVASVSTSSTSLTDATGLTVTITTTGRPVFIGLIGTEAYTSYVEFNGTTGMNVAILRDSTVAANQFFYKSTAGTANVPVTSVSHIDSPASGTYTYKIQFKVGNASDTITLIRAKLIAYEL